MKIANLIFLLMLVACVFSTPQTIYKSGLTYKIDYSYSTKIGGQDENKTTNVLIEITYANNYDYLIIKDTVGEVEVDKTAISLGNGLYAFEMPVQEIRLKYNKEVQESDIFSIDVYGYNELPLKINAERTGDLLKISVTNKITGQEIKNLRLKVIYPSGNVEDINATQEAQIKLDEKGEYQIYYRLNQKKAIRIKIRNNEQKQEEKPFFFEMRKYAMIFVALFLFVGIFLLFFNLVNKNIAKEESFKGNEKKMDTEEIATPRFEETMAKQRERERMILNRKKSEKEELEIKRMTEELIRKKMKK